MRFFVIAILLSLFSPALALSPPAPFRLPHQYKDGGDITGFMKAYKWHFDHNERIILDGKCLSACTIGLKYSNVCVMPGTILGFHAAHNERDGSRNERGTAVLQSAVPPELIGHQVKLPLKRWYQYVKASELPDRYLCIPPKKI